MTLVWVSPGLPADQAALASALPVEYALVPLPPIEDAAAFSGLATGSLCVTTVFETELLARLEQRPSGVLLLVVTPADDSWITTPPTTGVRPAEATAPASSVGELATAIRGMLEGPTIPAQSARSPLRGRLFAGGAVLGALAIGAVVLATTESSSAAGSRNAANAFGNVPFAATGPGEGLGAPGGGSQVGPGGSGPVGPGGGGGLGGGQAPPGAGTGNMPGAVGQQLLACLRDRGVTVNPNQLRLRTSDPKLRQAFFDCLQQLGPGSFTLPSRQLPGRP